MAYIRTNWINGTTPINAEKLNNIEAGISNNDTALSSKQGYFSAVNWVNVENAVLTPGGEGYVLLSGRFKFAPQSGIPRADDDIVNYDMLKNFFTEISGYNSSKNQVLTHDDSGVLRWVDSE